jgi:hypothetical protein
VQRLQAELRDAHAALKALAVEAAEGKPRLVVSERRTAVAAEATGSAELSLTEVIDDFQPFEDLDAAALDELVAATPAVERRAAHVAMATIVGVVASAPVVKTDGKNGDFAAVAVRVQRPMGAADESDVVEVRAYSATMLRYCVQTVRAGAVLHVMGHLVPCAGAAGAVAPIVVAVCDDGCSMNIVFAETP